MFSKRKKICSLDIYLTKEELEDRHGFITVKSDGKKLKCFIVVSDMILESDADNKKSYHPLDSIAHELAHFIIHFFDFANRRMPDLNGGHTKEFNSLLKNMLKNIKNNTNPKEGD